MKLLIPPRLVGEGDHERSEWWWGFWLASFWVRRCELRPQPIQTGLSKIPHHHALRARSPSHRRWGGIRRGAPLRLICCVVWPVPAPIDGCRQPPLLHRGKRERPVSGKLQALGHANRRRVWRLSRLPCLRRA